MHNVQYCSSVHQTYPVWHEIELEHGHRTEGDGEATEEAQHGEPAGGRRENVIGFPRNEQVAVGILVGANFTGRALPLWDARSGI